MGTLSGVVSDEENDAPVGGALVTLGAVSATTSSDGRFVLPPVLAGPYRITISATHFDTWAQDVSILAGNNSRSFLLATAGTFHPSGNTLVYVPPSVSMVRGVFVVLYGGTADSRPLLRGELDFYLNLGPAGDVTGYRAALRAFAREKSFAVLGMKTPLLLETGGAIAADILQGLEDASRSSTHPELADAPLILQGMSNGACAVDKVVGEIPSRVIGFIAMKGPPTCSVQGGSPVRSVPGYFFLGELDAREVAVAVTRNFEEHRGLGAVWALAIEPGAGHVWVRNHPLIFSWAGAVAAQRLPATVTPGTPVALRPVSESSGWLGDRTSFLIAGYPCFTGNKPVASWLPTEQTAREWQSMGSGTTVLVCP